MQDRSPFVLENFFSTTEPSAFEGLPPLPPNAALEKKVHPVIKEKMKNEEKKKKTREEKSCLAPAVKAQQKDVTGIL